MKVAPLAVYFACALHVLSAGCKGDDAGTDQGGQPGGSGAAGAGAGGASGMGGTGGASGAGGGAGTSTAGSGAGTGGDAGAGTGGNAGAGGPMLPSSCEACSTSCVVAHVSADIAPADATWTLFPDEATGRGRVLVGAAQGPGGTVAESIDGVDLRMGLQPQDVVLCTASTDARVFCFLDDEGDGELRESDASLTRSTDYIDTCPRERDLMATMTATGVGEVDCTLEVTCD